MKDTRRRAAEWDDINHPLIYRHAPDGGMVRLTRSDPYGAVDRAACDRCGARWERQNGRFRWHRAETHP